MNTLKPAPVDNAQQAIDAAKNAHDHNSQDFKDVYSNIVQLQQKDHDPAQFKADMAKVSEGLHKQGILSDFEITGIDGNNHLVGTKNGQPFDIVASNTSDVFQAGTTKNSFLQGVENVASKVGKGALDEVTHHFDHIVESAAVGVAIGTAAVFASPFVATAAAVAGGGLLAWQLYKNVPGWVNDAKVVANPQFYSKNEVSAADKGAEGFGAGGANVAAGIAGTYAGGMLGTALKAELAARAAAAADAEEAGSADSTGHHAHMQHHNVAQAAGQISDPSGGQSDAPGPDGKPIAPSLEAPAPRAPETPVTPESVKPGADVETKTTVGETVAEAQTPLEKSIADSQGLFHAANTDGDGVLLTQKQNYNVRFSKITEPGTIQTLENRAGESVTPGQWVATRLQPDGQPVVEDGIVNQWPVTEKTILKTYKVTPEQLATSNEVIGATKPGTVHMVMLPQDTTIQTSWGPMSGKAGDYLANYDYDPATKAAGESYAIITAKSWGETYELVAHALGITKS